MVEPLEVPVRVIVAPASAAPDGPAVVHWPTVPDMLTPAGVGVGVGVGAGEAVAVAVGVGEAVAVAVAVGVGEGGGAIKAFRTDSVTLSEPLCQPQR